MLLVQDLICRARDMEGRTESKALTCKSSNCQGNPSTDRDPKQLSRTPGIPTGSKKGGKSLPALVSDVMVANTYGAFTHVPGLGGVFECTFP